MTTTTPYSQAHIYLDESGLLHGGADETDLPQVGGVVLLGDAIAADGELLDILRESATHVGAPFPAGLHGRRTALRQRIIQQVRRRLGAWHGGRDILCGAVIRHEQDLAPDGGLLTAEARADNRYQRMLIDLLQHLLFVAPGLRARLAPDAEVFLHLASRKVIFAPGQATREQLEALGHHIHDHDDPPGSLRVGLTLRPGDLAAILRGTVQQTWPGATVRFGAPPSVAQINYDAAFPPSPAGLYLADLLLWQGRQQSLGADAATAMLALPGLLPEEVVLAYGPALDRQMRRNAALARGDVGAYLLLCREADEQGPAPSGDAAAVRDAEERQAARLMAEQGVSPEALAEYASRVVDEPGRVAEGRSLAERARRLNDLLPEPDSRARLHVLQALMSAANHTGSVATAGRLWEEYRTAEQSLGVSQEVQQFVTEMRNRWAVNLTDHFRPQEACDMLQEFIRVKEEALTAAARAMGRERLTGPIPELGAPYGTLAQSHAFLGGEDNSRWAEACFRQALALQQGSDEGCARQWDYLGHLACDRGEAGRPLWEEVCAHLPDLAAPEPITAEKGQYHLALQLKGLLCFGTPATRQAYLAAWETKRPLEHYPEPQRVHHPFGLIHQALGLLHARVWAETGDAEHARQALAELERAAAHMEAQGPLLHVLGRLARLRRALLAREVYPNRPGVAAELGALLRSLRDLVRRTLGAAAWDTLGHDDPGEGAPPEERARRVLVAVRFNYW